MIIYLHIHGTTGVTPESDNMLLQASSKSAKFFACHVYPDQFTGDTKTQLLPLSQAPIAAQRFPQLSDLAHDQDRYYFQWSGNLGEDAWDKAASFLSKQLLSLQATSNEPTHILIHGHSHGGHIARLTAEKLLSHEHFIFHMITNAMPLSHDQTTLMPANVKTWLHFFHALDGVAWIGSKLMKDSLFSTVKRKIEDVAANLPTDRIWQSFELVFSDLDPHARTLKQDVAQIICDIAYPILLDALKNSHPEVEPSLGLSY